MSETIKKRKPGKTEYVKAVRAIYPNAYSGQYLNGYAVWSDKTKKGSVMGGNVRLAVGDSLHKVWRNAKISLG